MILYVNGDSHSAAAEALNNYSFASDDSLYYNLGRIPHPDNERVSYGCMLANSLNAVLHIDAEAASSNDRIIRTTRDYLKTFTPEAIVIGWSTWEREEWFYDGIWWQINGSGIEHDWPEDIKEKYKSYISNYDYAKCELKSHYVIHEFHKELLDLGIPHLFFNTYNCFVHVRLNNLPKYDWGNSYIEPYLEEFTYYNWLTAQGYKPKSTYHYGPEAHQKWAEFLLPHLTKIL